MQKRLLFILLLSFFFACGNQEKHNSRYSEQQISSLYLDSTKILKVASDSLIKIDLNRFLKRQSFDFGSLVSEVKLLPLETTSESLISGIYKVLVSDSNIYIMDNFKGCGIIIFDKEGHFVKRIPNGQGPGELARLYDIAYDMENNELIAYQHSFLLFFTSSGEFIRQMRLPFGFYNFTVIPDGYVFKVLDRQGNGHLGIFEDYHLLITDKQFRVKFAGMPHAPLGEVLISYNYLYNNNQNIIVTQAYTDTLYQYKNATKYLSAKYVLDYSRKKLPERYLHYSSFAEFDKGTRNNDYSFYIGQYQETTTHDVFFLENCTIGQTVIYRDKLSGNIIGGTEANYKTYEIPPVAFPVSATDNSLISFFLPDASTESLLSNSSIISPEDKSRLKGLTEEDNPVMVFFQLKNF